MGLFGFRNRSTPPVEVQPVKETPPINIETRSSDFEVPEKVFIDRDGRGLEYSFDDARIDALLGGYYADNNFIQLFYCLPEIAAAVHAIASRVSDANWQLRRYSNDEVISTDAQFNRLFTDPNPLISFRDFVYQAVCYEILTGKQFFYANVPSTLPFEWENVVNWFNLAANCVKIHKHPNVDVYSITSISDLIAKYTIPQNGGNRVFAVKNVLPFLRLSLKDGNDVTKVKSQLRGADKAIDNLIPVYEARGMIYVHRGPLGLWVSKKSDVSGNTALTKSEKLEATQDMQATYGVTKGKSTFGVTSLPMEFVQSGGSIDELKPFDETLSDAVVIYAVLDIPRHLVPSKDASTFSNADADMKEFYNGNIIPRANRYAQAWTSWFKLDARKDGRLQRYIHADFSHVSCLQGNRKDEATVDKVKGATYLERFQNGVCSLNEWRVATGEKKHTNPLYDKLTIDMTPEELEAVKKAINLKQNGTGQSTTSEDTGDKTKGQNDK
jgi:hypothetical protein